MRSIWRKNNEDMTLVRGIFERKREDYMTIYQVVGINDN